jgi:hypothetical protein
MKRIKFLLRTDAVSRLNDGLPNALNRLTLLSKRRSAVTHPTFCLLWTDDTRWRRAVVLPLLRIRHVRGSELGLSP